MYEIETTPSGGVRVTLPGGETDDLTGEYSSFKAAVDAIGGSGGKRNKYNAKKVKMDGFTFDSIKEANRYKELVIRWRAGEIENLEVHPRYEVHPAFTDSSGKSQRAIFYEADFSYQEGGWWIVEDIKSKATMTPLFKVKQKLFMKKYPAAHFNVIG